MYFLGISWCRLLLIFALLPALLVLNSCGGGSTTSTTTTPTITASCAASSVTVNGQVQCTATITNLSSTLVNWSVSGTGTGAINSSGLYTAPATVPTNNVVTITAAAQAQTSLTATATITIQQPTTISAVVCLDAAQASTLTVASGMSLACTATSSTNSPIPVFWEVNTITGGNATIGKISAQGNYVAPLVPPAGGTVTITAVSQAVSTQMLSVTVTVTFGNAVLQGPYAFSTSGRVTVTSAFFARAGSFSANGQGTLIGGREDSNQAGTVRQRIFTGTYSIGTDGQGTMQFCEDISTTCTAAAATAYFRVAVISPQQAQIIEFSAPNSSAALTATGGEMNLQDISVFNTGGLAGTYSFNFAGVSSSSALESTVGEFNADGHGTISAGNAAALIPGELDINNGGAQVLTASSYSINADGRGTATITTAGGSLKFAVYMISASRAKFIEIDSSPASILAGDAFKQQASASCSWSASALSGAIVFETGGTGSNGGIGDLVSFTASSGAFTDGSIDENSGGTVSSAQSLSGTYAVDADGCGRGTLSIASPAHSYVFYIIAQGKAVIQETTAGVIAHGFLVPSQGGPFTTASFTGSYALSLAGTNAAGPTGKREDIVGQVTANGTGNVTSGSFDINSFGATQTGVAEIGTYTSVAANGRTTMALTTGTFVLYLVSPSQMYVLGTNTTSFAIGSLNKQF
jgi:hypothetical protein